MGALDSMIIGYIRSRGYARTYHIADQFRESTPTMRRRLLRLEKRGEVKRDERSSAVNDICWILP